MARANERSYATRAQIKRVIDAAKDAGIVVGGIEITPDGTIRVISEALAISANREPTVEEQIAEWRRRKWQK